MYAINGSITYDFDYVYNNNSDIITKDISSISKPPEMNHFLNYVLMDSIKSANIISTFRGGWDLEKQTFFLQNKFITNDVEKEKILKPYEYAWYLIENLNMNISGNKLTANLGDFSGSAFPIVLGSRNIRGAGLNFKNNFTKKMKIKRSEIVPLLKSLDNPFGNNPFNLLEFYEKANEKTSSFIQVNVFGGLSEMRDLTLAEEETGSNSRFDPEETIEDITGNDIRDSARSARYTEYIYGGLAAARIKYFTTGGAYVQTIQSDRKMITNSSLGQSFVVNDNPYDKKNFGGMLYFHLLRDMLNISSDFGYLIKDDNIRIETNDLKKRWAASTSITYNTPSWNTVLNALYSQPGYEDAAGTSSAEENIISAQLDNTMSLKFGTIKAGGGWKRDNIQTSKFFISSPAVDTKHALTAVLGYSKAFRPFNFNLSANGSYNFSQVPAALSNTASLTNIRVDFLLSLANITAGNFSFAPQGKFTFFLNEVEKEKNYYSWYGKLGIQTRLFDKRLNLGLNGRFNQKLLVIYLNSRNIKPVNSLETGLTTGFKIKPGRLDYNNNFTYKRSWDYFTQGTLDYTAASTTNTNLTAYSVPYNGATVDNLDLKNEMNIFLSSRIKLTARYTFAWKLKNFEADRAKIPLTGNLEVFKKEDYLIHLFGASLTVLF
ncbi:MAG TPA: hypothetical protein DC049_18625 [Spirochaetia bacterium]|nr:hypothetical protein [Spirochaetia bacterium]